VESKTPIKTILIEMPADDVDLLDDIKELCELSSRGKAVSMLLRAAQEITPAQAKMRLPKNKVAPPAC